MSLARLFSRLTLRRWQFTTMYLRRRTPWDTGITPPELRAVVEGPAVETPGRALDIGCGTGLNSIYLAEHGWDVTGIDFATPAIARARERLHAAETAAGPPLPVLLLRGDATRLRAEGVTGPFTLVFDLGCLHGIPRENRPAYAREVAALTAPGALYLLYAFNRVESPGLTDDDVLTLFGGAFRVERVERGADSGRDQSARPSAWRWLRREV